MKVLEYESDFLRAYPRQLLRTQVRNVFLIQPDLARTRAVQAADQIHQRGFSRTRRSHYGNPLSGLYTESKIIERANSAARSSSSCGIESAESIQPNHLFSSQDHSGLTMALQSPRQQGSIQRNY